MIVSEGVCELMDGQVGELVPWNWIFLSLHVQESVRTNKARMMVGLGLGLVNLRSW